MPDHILPPSRFRAAGLGLAAAGLLALGGATGAVVTAATRPPVAMAPASPVAIRSLSSGSIVTIRGRVAEVYGNKFVVEDGTGRALVDTGPRGDDRSLAAVGEPVMVQGRFEHGFLHAAFLVAGDGKVTALGPLAGPPHGPRGAPDCGLGGPPPPEASGRTPPPHAPDGVASTAPAAQPPATH